MTNTTATNNSDDAEQKVDDTRPAAPLGGAVATAPVVNNQPKNPYLRRPISIAAMGIQSQLRGGSVKACLKRGTKRKAQSYKQSAVPGGSIFIPWKHCIICKVERLNQLGQGKNGRPRAPGQATKM